MLNNARLDDLMAKREIINRVLEGARRELFDVQCRIQDAESNLRFVEEQINQTRNQNG
jgi:predicted  nucleic acid-binding Zn-ribbon protein